MRIIDLLSEDRILLGASAQTKEQAIDQMVELQAKSGSLKDKEVYKQAILAREQMSAPPSRRASRCRTPNPTPSPRLRCAL